MKHHPNEKKQQHRGNKILLVDDEEDIIWVLRRGLELQGFDVDAYTSPKEALTFFKPNTYHLAILDIRMPGMNGFMLYRKLKEQDPSLGACFLSAFEIHQDEFKKVFPSMADSVKKIIKKPVTINKMIKEITPILETSLLERAARQGHVLVVYETPTELIDQSLEFLKVGLLENNEDVMLITGSIPIESIRSKIVNDWKIEDLDALEASGRVSLYTFREWYMPDGKFDLKQIGEQVRKKIEQTTAGGRQAIRCVGDVSPFFELGMQKELLKCEKALGRHFDFPFRSICAYISDKIQQFDGASIQLLHQYHDKVVSGGEDTGS